VGHCLAWLRMLPSAVTDIKAFVPGIMCKPPEMQHWGLRILYLNDLRAFFVSEAVPSRRPDRVERGRFSDRPMNPISR